MFTAAAGDAKSQLTGSKLSSLRSEIALTRNEILGRAYLTGTTAGADLTSSHFSPTLTMNVPVTPCP